MTRRSRREVLGLAGSAGALAIAGCLSGGEPDLDSFSPPPGFASEGIDGRAALGTNSPMADLDSVSLEHEWLIEFPDFRIRSEQEGQFSFAEPMFSQSRQTFDSLTSELTLVGLYFDSMDLFRRERVEPRSIESQYTARPHTFDSQQDLGLGELQQIIRGVEAELSEVEEVDGELVGVYTADTEAFGDDTLVQQVWSASFGETQSASIELRVTEAGHFSTVDLAGTFQGPEAEPVELTAEWRFFDVNETTVEEPEWLVELPSRERPEVEVVFEEVEGDVVNVEIRSIEYTGEVAVVIEDYGVVDSVTSPGTISVPADSYTTEEGNVLAIMVLAEDRLRGPVEIDRYWPTTAADS